MPCKRKERKRHNTIAFWLTDEEKAKVEAKIALSGMNKGEYYRACILKKQVNVKNGIYLSNRLAKALEEILQETRQGNLQEVPLLQELLQQLLEQKEKENK